MATSAEAQSKVDSLQAQLLTLQSEIQQKQQQAAEAVLDGKNAEKFQDEIGKREGQLRTVQTAKKLAEERLSEAKAQEAAQKQKDAEGRMKEIREELDTTADTLEQELRTALVIAGEFESLLKEAQRLKSMGVNSNAVSSWVNFLYGRTFTQVLSETIHYLNQHRPKI